MDAVKPKFDTALLGRVRQLRDQFPQLTNGDIAKFRIVIDANIVISDLVQRVRHPERLNTAIQELILATVFELHAPRWLDIEMYSAIENASRQLHISEQALLDEWLRYRVVIRWDDSLVLPPINTKASGDPKDLPYIALAKKISAHGILTRDIDIARMGGHSLDFEFVLTTRNYARAVATSAGIRTGGVGVTVVALKLLESAARPIIRALSALPPPVKALTLLAIALAIAHPNSRKKILEALAKLADIVLPAWDVLAETYAFAANMDREAQLHAAEHLEKASKAIRSKVPNGRAQNRSTKRRRRLIHKPTAEGDTQA